MVYVSMYQHRTSTPSQAIMDIMWTTPAVPLPQVTTSALSQVQEHLWQVSTSHSNSLRDKENYENYYLKEHLI